MRVKHGHAGGRPITFVVRTFWQGSHGDNSATQSARFCMRDTVNASDWKGLNFVSLVTRQKVARQNKEENTYLET